MTKPLSQNAMISDIHKVIDGEVVPYSKETRNLATQNIQPTPFQNFSQHRQLQSSIIVFPQHTNDVARIVKYAYQNEIPVYSNLVQTHLNQNPF